MLRRPNRLQWDGAPGHYEVYYLTLTDPVTGVGCWLRYSMLAPLAEADHATAALWFAAMDPRPGRRATIARKLSFPVEALRSEVEPFRLRIGSATLTDSGSSGSVEDAAWELRWAPSRRSYEHVHPLLRRARVAQTTLVLAQADLSIDGTISFAGERLELAGARGGQAHLWGSKHAARWAWVHCNDFRSLDGEPVRDTFVDGVSVIVRRLGRELGPSTPVLARVDGEDFSSTSPLRVLANSSTFALTGWRFEAVDQRRKLIGEVDAARAQLVGVGYADPDGALAHCYNSETASMRLHVYERARQVGGWAHRRTLVADGRTHFEYGQRAPVAGLELLA